MILITQNKKEKRVRTNLRIKNDMTFMVGYEVINDLFRNIL